MLNLRLICMSLVFISAAANSDDFSKYLNDVSVYRGQGQSKIKAFDPQGNLPKYSSKPQEEKYYGGVEQSSDNIDSDAEKSADNNDAMQSVYHAFDKRQHFKINQKSYSISNSKFIQGHSPNIARGISDQYVNCNQKPTCHTSFENKSCITGVPTHFTCKQTLTASVKEEVIDTPETVSGTTTGNSHSYTGHISVPPGTTWIKSIQVHLHNGGVNFEEVYKSYINGAFISNSNNTGGFLHPGYDVYFPKTAVNIPVTSTDLVFSIGGGASISTWWDTGYYTLDIIIEKHVKKVNTSWIGNCSNISKHAHVVSQKCTEGPSTKTIDGVPITEPCWARTMDYASGSSESEDCKALEAEDCEQIGSTPNGDGLFRQDYICPEKMCGVQLVCDKNVYCIDGDCAPKDDKPNKDFDKAAAAMAGVDAAAKDMFDSKGTHAFSGAGEGCTEGAVGENNCCDLNGWLHGLLMNCSDSEKALLAARQKKTATYVGEHCVHEIHPAPGTSVCLEKGQVWCQFDNKFARIVQEQGRRDQLGIGFGSADSPNCSGISIDQLQKIDFDKIDFSDAFSDINSGTNLPNPSTTSDDLARKAKAEAQAAGHSGG